MNEFVGTVRLLRLASLDTAGMIVVSIVTAFLLAVAAVGIRQRDIPA
ncbi:hypothetical protein [Calidifontibacter indicus]